MKDGDILPSPVFYLDSSAIAKRYVDENGTGFLNAMYEFEVKRGGRLFTSELSISEVLVVNIQENERRQTE